MDKLAKKTGDAPHWAAWKYNKYYKDITEEDKKLHAKLARNGGV